MSDDNKTYWWQAPHYYLFLDTETTGLDPDDEIWQLAYILETDKGELVKKFDGLIEHRTNPSPWVLGNTDYRKKLMPAAGGKSPSLYSLGEVLAKVKVKTEYFDNPICGYMTKSETPISYGTPVYLVGAVPGFDDRIIRRQSGIDPPWHYHIIDVEALIMGYQGLLVPPSTAELEKITGVKNSGAHDAMADAQHVRDLFHWWKNEVRLPF